MNIQRILKNVIMDSNGCWNWQKSCNSAGYGQLTENKKYWLAHRYAYACSKQGLSDDVLVRHNCHNTKCCNPDHLMIGSNKDNYHDSIKTHLEAAKRQRNVWIVDDLQYQTVREASKKLKLHQATIIKYTVDGVFNIDAYRKGCKKARVLPKI